MVGRPKPFMPLQGTRFINHVMFLKHCFNPLLLLTLLIPSLYAQTDRHEQGLCALYGQCGGKTDSAFARQLPCPTQVTPSVIDDDAKDLLIETCGTLFDPEKALCCEAGQLQDLASNLKMAHNLISVCPACWENFKNFWCTFTCSPNQSTFVNVTQTMISPRTKKEIATEIDLFVNPIFGTNWFDSCKDVKFPADNVFVMDLIGGGAKDWHAMVTFMGKENPQGSPFTISFPLEHEEEITPLMIPTKRCNDSDTNFRCSCVDCESSCLAMPPTPSPPSHCQIGSWSCLAVGLTIFYGLLVGGLAFASTGSLSWNSSITPSASLYLEEEESREIDEPPPRRTWWSQWFGRTEATSEVDDVLDDGEYVERESKLHDWIDTQFYRLGAKVTSRPWTVLGLGVIAVLLLCIGWVRFAVETQPINLWVGKDSDAANQKRFFDDQFGPFYRTEQIIFSHKHNQSLIEKEYLEQLFLIQDAIEELRGPKTNVTLANLCARPFEGSACIIQSVTGYWQDDLQKFRVLGPNWRSNFDLCTYRATSCLPLFGQPLKPDLIFGGFQEQFYNTSKALIVTYVNKNYKEQETDKISQAEDWEAALSNFLENIDSDERFSLKDMNVAFSTESSLEWELNKQSSADIKTIVASYLVMFFYVSLSLGRYTSISRFPIESKFTLGFGGILIVLASVAASVGLLSMMGWKTSLIIAEVIPFLVLAVGVDNIFILLHAVERMDPNEPPEERISLALSSIGPSLMLSALSEAIAFSMGIFVSMPAVRSFAIYASVAVIINFILQITSFVALLTLDMHRMESWRMDCMPCIRLSRREVLDNLDSGNFNASNDANVHGLRGEGYGLFHYYASMLLRPASKVFVMLFFIALLLFNVVGWTRLEPGLDQRVALPVTSHLVPYFNDLDNYFRVGPPVYFVAKGINQTSREGQLALCGRFPTCNQHSLANILEMERKRPEYSYLAQPTANWIDDFFFFLDPQADSCCRTMDGQVCQPDDMDPRCQVCFESRSPPWNITLDGMPVGTEFVKYLGIFLETNPMDACPVAGSANYKSAITIDHNQSLVSSSTFRTFHTPLKSQHDYIAAYQQALRISKDISDANPGLQVFPYSIFYVFFEQYNHISKLALTLLVGANLAIFVCTALLLSIRAAILILFVVTLILVNMVGVMGWWGINLNAISVVNLLISAGIAVEFCSHLIRAYMVTRGGKQERSHRALVDIGSSVFAGITLTKFVGVSVLSFANSLIFVIFYFRMYLALVILGALHGLVLLPVLLTWFGDKTVILSSTDRIRLPWENPID